MIRGPNMCGETTRPTLRKTFLRIWQTRWLRIGPGRTSKTIRPRCFAAFRGIGAFVLLTWVCVPSLAASGQPDDYERAIAKNDLRQALALALADQRDDIKRQFRVGYVKLLLDDMPAAKGSFQSCYNAAGLPETTALCAAGLSVASVV